MTYPGNTGPYRMPQDICEEEEGILQCEAHEGCEEEEKVRASPELIFEIAEGANEIAEGANETANETAEDTLPDVALKNDMCFVVDAFGLVCLTRVFH